ncbi:hypothetical protein HDU93_001284 [Gonapodya sp. JEL0774]|nr:hypothetical protein HDU93_001284 [Gonapodya sp. JEL0774]
MIFEYCCPSTPRGLALRLTFSAACRDSYEYIFADDKFETAAWLSHVACWPIEVSWWLIEQRRVSQVNTHMALCPPVCLHCLDELSEGTGGSSLERMIMQRCVRCSRDERWQLVAGVLNMMNKYAIPLNEIQLLRRTKGGLLFIQSVEAYAVHKYGCVELVHIAALRDHVVRTTQQQQLSARSDHILFHSLLWHTQGTTVCENSLERFLNQLRIGQRQRYQEVYERRTELEQWIGRGSNGGKDKGKDSCRGTRWPFTSRPTNGFDLLKDWNATIQVYIMDGGESLNRCITKIKEVQERQRKFRELQQLRAVKTKPAKRKTETVKRK